jgi:arginase
MTRRLTVIGVPSGAGACGVGQEQTLRRSEAPDSSSSSATPASKSATWGTRPVVPWRPDRTRPRAQNLEDVVGDGPQHGQSRRRRAP